MVPRSVYMDRLENSGQHSRLCEHSPQLPQGFTPVDNITFWPGDKILPFSPPSIEGMIGLVSISVACRPTSGCNCLLPAQ